MSNIFLKLELFFLELLGFDVKLAEIKGKWKCLVIKADHLSKETFAEFTLKAIKFFKDEKIGINEVKKELYIFYD